MGDSGIDVEGAALLAGFPVSGMIRGVERLLEDRALWWAPDGSDRLVPLPFDREGNIVH